MTLTLIVFAILIVVFVGLALCLLILADRQRRRHLARLRRGRLEAPSPVAKVARRKSDKPRDSSLFDHVERQLAQTSLRVSLVELSGADIAGCARGLFDVGPAFGNVPAACSAGGTILPLSAAALVIKMAQGALSRGVHGTIARSA